MPRRKYPKPEECLSRLIGVRLKERDYDKFKAMLHNTNCQTVGELLRAIVMKEKIFFYYEDGTMKVPFHELAGIHSAIKAIGRNINQITHHFHQADDPKKKLFLSLNVAAEYKKVGKKEEELVTLIEAIARKWLDREPVKAGFKLEEFRILRVPFNFDESSNKSRDKSSAG